MSTNEESGIHKESIPITTDPDEIFHTQKPQESLGLTTDPDQIYQEKDENPDSKYDYVAMINAEVNQIVDGIVEVKTVKEEDLGPQNMMGWSLLSPGLIEIKTHESQKDVIRITRTDSLQCCIEKGKKEADLGPMEYMNFVEYFSQSCKGFIHEVQEATAAKIPEDCNVMAVRFLAPKQEEIDRLQASPEPNQTQEVTIVKKKKKFKKWFKLKETAKEPKDKKKSWFRFWF